MDNPYYIDLNSSISTKPILTCELNEAQWYKEFVDKLSQQEMYFLIISILNVIFNIAYDYLQESIYKKIVRWFIGFFNAFIIIWGGLKLLYRLGIEDHPITNAIFIIITLFIVGKWIYDYFKFKIKVK